MTMINVMYTFLYYLSKFDDRFLVQQIYVFGGNHVICEGVREALELDLLHQLEHVVLALREVEFQPADGSIERNIVVGLKGFW